MIIEGFVKTTLLEWEGKNACKIVIADCDPAFQYHIHESGSTCSEVGPESILSYIDDHIDFLTGVIISGGEPSGVDGLYRFLKEIKKRKIPVRMDTFGLCPDALDDLIGAKMADCVCMNIPAPLDPDIYSGIVGKTVNISDIRRTLDIIESSGVESIFRTVAIPDIVDKNSIEKIAKEIPFAKQYFIIRNTSMKKSENYNDAEMMEMGRVAKRFVKNVNVRDIRLS